MTFTKKPKVKQAVILAGGLGVRLRPLTHRIPKPMVPVNGKPFIEYLINDLKKNGIKKIVFLLGYLPDRLVNYFGDGCNFGLEIKYSIGGLEDETGTRIKNAAEFLDDKFLLLYGDNYWPMNLKKMSDLYYKLGAPATMTVYSNKNGDAEYGARNNIQIDKDGYIIGYGPLTEDPKMQGQGVDIGFFILDRKLVNQMPETSFEFQGDFLPRLIEKKQLGAYMTDDFYHTITSIDFLKRTEKFFKTKKW